MVSKTGWNAQFPPEVSRYAIQRFATASVAVTRSHPLLRVQEYCDSMTCGYSQNELCFKAVTADGVITALSNLRESQSCCDVHGNVLPKFGN